MLTNAALSPAEIRISETRYRRLFETAQDGILILNEHTLEITDANPFLTELLGFTRNELLGKELWEIGLFDNRRASQAAFQELQLIGDLRYENMPLRTKRGITREVEFICHVYTENGDKVIQCTIRDITERKALEMARFDAEAENRQLRDTLERRVADRTAELESANKELEAFSYSVSHDLRAPLRHIDGFAQMLSRREAERLDGTSAHYLTVIAGATAKMGVLVDELLAFSKTGRQEMRTRSVDLNERVSDACRTLALETDDRQIMPKMNGMQLKNEVKKLLPDIKYLFMSGYTDDSISRTEGFDAGTAFIEKPFTPDSLARKVREELDRN